MRTKKMGVENWAVKKFCSRTCLHASMRRDVGFDCPICGVLTIRRASYVNRYGSTSFCSRKCSATFRHRNPTAIRNANYGKNRDKFKSLYGDTCVLCGFNRYVEFAHVIPARRGGTIHPTNIIVLCPNHHSLFDRNLLNKEEQDVVDDYIIQAWGSVRAARFEESAVSPSSEQ